MKSHGKPRKSFRRIVQKGIAIMGMCFLILISTNLTIRCEFYYNAKGTAEWIDTEGQRYLSVEAESYFDLGFLTGIALASRIFQLKLLLTFLAPQFNYSYNRLKSSAQAYVPFIPSVYIEEMMGLSRGATAQLGIVISFEDILVQNTWMDIVYGQLLPNAVNPLGCTSFAIQNANFSITYGQNFDFTAIFARTACFVLHNVRNTTRIFGLRFGASLNLPIGKNSHQVGVLVSLVNTNISSVPALPIMIRTRIAFEQALTASLFLDHFFLPLYGNQTASFCLLVSDITTFYSIDITPTESWIETSNWSVKTNTFTRDELQLFLTNITYSKDRQQYAEEQVQQMLNDTLCTTSELMCLLQLPLIARKAHSMQEIGTMAFFTNVHFGMGPAVTNSWGILPI